MSTRYDVGVTFQRDDWEEKVYPQLKEKLNGLDDRMLGRIDVDKIISWAEKDENDEFVTLRWQNYPAWGLDSFTTELENAAKDESKYEADYICLNTDTGEVDESLNLGAGQFQLQSPALRSKNEPYTEQSDRIITKLMQSCMEKGITVGKLKEVLKGVASKDIIENFAQKAQEQAKNKTNTSAR